MKRKWELIAWYCHKNGYSKSAAFAELIDQKLVELYDMKIAPDMEKDYEGHVLFLCKDSGVELFASGMKCCVACVVHKDLCLVCKFGKATGMCTSNDPEALFNQFIAAFKEERKDFL